MGQNELIVSLVGVTIQLIPLQKTFGKCSKCPKRRQCLFVTHQKRFSSLRISVVGSSLRCSAGLGSSSRFARLAPFGRLRTFAPFQHLTALRGTALFCLVTGYA